MWDWQALSPAVGPGAEFFVFCDAMEVKDNVSATADGWGLDHALNTWGSFLQNGYLTNCEQICRLFNPKAYLSSQIVKQVDKLTPSMHAHSPSAAFLLKMASQLLPGNLRSRKSILYEYHDQQRTTLVALDGVRTSFL